MSKTYMALLRAIAHQTYVEERWEAGGLFLEWKREEERIRKISWERYVGSWRYDRKSGTIF